jgi:hypothetical protein
MTTETERAKASDRQEAGNHYKDMPIQPAEFCQRNRLNWCEANVVKYVCRHRDKKGTEDIRKAIHYLELLLEWEYPCSIDRYAAIHTPLPPEEVERISGKVAPLPLLCKTCGQEDCSTNRMNECEKYAQCARWIEKPASSLRERIAEAKEDAHSYEIREANGVKLQPGQFYHIKAEAKEPQALDLSLPSITLECTAAEAYAKYLEECTEVDKAGTVLHSLIELWDCIQAVQTSIEKGGEWQSLYAGLMADMLDRERRGNQVLLARRAMLMKNAARWRYSDSVNRIIIESSGERWK